MSATEMHILTIGSFASGGRVCRAFGHLLAASDGALLCVPMVVAAGDLRAVLDGCPVPWEEAWAVLDLPTSGAQALAPAEVARRWPRLAAWRAEGWVLDRVPPFLEGRRVGWRLSHPSGVRFAKV